MRVAWLEIENFRSIEWLRLEGLDKPHVVIEGPNDVGKSNILHALDLAFSTLPTLLRVEADHDVKSIPGEPSEYPDWVKDWQNLFQHGKDSFSISLGIRFESRDGARGWRPPPGEIIDYRIKWTREGERIEKGLRAPLAGSPWSGKVLEGMAWSLAPAFRLVTTRREPGGESLHLHKNTPWESQVRWHGSNLKQLLFLYKNSPDLEVQERFEQLRAAVRDPALGIGIVNVSVQPNQKINVRTRQNGVELDLEERGTGIQQLLTLLALTLCHRGRILAVEEPEMNLSEPNQRLLWKKLREFTGETGPMDQVFVTSHSRVFEEEAERLVVSRDPQDGTQARWADPVPARQQADEELLQVTRGGGVTLPFEVLKQLGIQDGKHVYLVPSRHGYQLLGPQGYADHLREEGSDAESTG
ncbi:AAA domain-containing protein [Archangium gephyra]|uniref:AAA domain-containing protein n=2 Tax=Archangium gephyra TaxID=48 RepID=A0ABX9JLR2_9BACT|nr:AAA domain-containing protein [Archangium gephyra]